ncbi:MAG: electron transfer flavoprotein subunit beta/FixA family protein [Magnetococcus sp. DMHC-6]
MKILVPLKQVPDPAAPLRIQGDGLGIDLQGVGTLLNPFDAIALEAAVRLREAGISTEVVVVSVGPESWLDTLRTALALGADRALLVETNAPLLEPLPIANCLKKICTLEQPRLVLAGRQSIDSDHIQTGPMLAALLGWGQATFANHIELSSSALEIIVTRDIEEGWERVALRLPAVITVDLRLNEPRYASLPNILQARKKPLQRLLAADLGVDLTPRWEMINITAPPCRPPGLRVKNGQELAQRLAEKLAAI